MSPKTLVEKETEFNVNYFDVSQACGYSFELFDTKSSLEEKSTFDQNKNFNEEIIQKMIEAYDGHRIDEAYKYMNEYLKSLK